MPSLNVLDFILIGILLVSVIIGLIRGFVREAISLVTWVAAVWVAWRYSQVVSVALAKFIANPVVRIWVARGGVVLGVILAGAIVGWLIRLLLRSAGLSSTDRMIGMLFGAARGAVLIAASVWVLRTAGMEQEPWWRESKLIPYAAPAADVMWSAAQQGLQQIQGVLARAE